MKTDLTRREFIQLTGTAAAGVSLMPLDAVWVQAATRTYKIATISWIAWSPINVADVKGFFKKEGVDVKLVTTADGHELKTLVKEKRVDIAFEMIGTIIGFYMEDIPVTIIGETDWSHGGDKIIVKKDIDPMKLKTLPIGVYLNNPAVTFFLNQYLSGIGIKLSECKVIEMEPTAIADHFIKGQFGVIVLYNPEALRAEREGGGKIVASTASYEGSMPEGMMILNEAFKMIPHEDLIKIFKAWINGIEWCNKPENWQEYMKIINEQTFKGMPPFSENDIKEMLNSVRIHDAKTLVERNRNDSGLYHYLKELKAFLSSNNLLKKDFNLEEIVSNKAIIAAAGNP